MYIWYHGHMNHLTWSWYHSMIWETESYYMLYDVTWLAQSARLQVSFTHNELTADKIENLVSHKILWLTRFFHTRLKKKNYKYESWARSWSRDRVQVTWKINQNHWVMILMDLVEEPWDLDFVRLQYQCETLAGRILDSPNFATESPGDIQKLHKPNLELLQGWKDLSYPHC
jgi:hypothetical protein